MTFSGHSTRSSELSGSMVRVASMWRAVTSALGTSSAEVPCSPPPCTAATSRVSPVAWPRGATDASTAMTATAAIPPKACQLGWRLGADSMMAPSAKPTWRTAHVMRMTPPTRTIPRNGPPTWLMPRLASGTPPNGNEKRTASTRANAAGRPITRQRPDGEASAARPWKQAKISVDTR